MLDIWKSHQWGDKVEAALIDYIFTKICEMIVPLLPHSLLIVSLSSISRMLFGAGQQ